MRKRIRRVGRATGPNSRFVTSALPQRCALFGPPQLLEGEDPAVYDQLLARICEAIKPVDVIDEMLIVDVVSLEWEVLRWRRLKFSLLRGVRLQALEHYLRDRVGLFAVEFAEVLRHILPKHEADAAEDLANRRFSRESDAVERVGRLAEVILLDYAHGEPAAVKMVDGFLAASGDSLDGLTAAALASNGDAR